MFEQQTCVLEAEGETILNSHQDHIAERGYHAMDHCGLTHTPIPIPKAKKIPAASAAVDKLNNLPVKRRRHTRSSNQKDSSKIRNFEGGAFATDFFLVLPETELPKV